MDSIGSEQWKCDRAGGSSCRTSGNLGECARGLRLDQRGIQ